MLIQKTSQTVFQAITAMQTDLPRLIGQDWPTVEPTLMAQIEALQTPDDTGRPVRALLRTLRDYPAVQTRLDIELKRQVLWNEAREATLSTLAQTLNLQPDTIRPAVDVGLQVTNVDEEAEKAILVPLPQEGQMGQAIQIDFFKLSGLLGGGLTLFAESPGASLLATAGLLTFIGGLGGAMPKRLSLEETSVFLGLIYAQNDDRVAHETKIMDQTNQERQHCHLPPLTEPQLNQSLSDLQALQVIKPLGDGHWRIIERYNFRGDL